MNIVHWLSSYRLKNIDELRFIDMASLRLRAGALLSALNRKKTKLVVGESIHPQATVCVIGKIGLPDIGVNTKNWLAQLEKFKSKGGRVFLDFTDNHLSVKTARTDFYLDCLKYVDCCVCSSEKLGVIMREQFLGEIQVIPDAIDIEVRPPAKNPGSSRTLLWFGHSRNLPYLMQFLPEIRVNRPASIRILTNATGVDFLHSNRPEIGQNLRLEIAEWSIKATVAAAAVSDLSFIPSDPLDPRKYGVSANRLQTALALGLPTAADVMPSYEPYKNYFADIRSGGFNAMIEDPLAWHEKVIEAQRLIVSEFSLPTIGLRWLRLVE